MEERLKQENEIREMQEQEDEEAQGEMALVPYGEGTDS